MSSKDNKKQIESLLESISKIESYITLHNSQGNKRAADIDKRVLKALKERLKVLKSQ